MLKKWYITLLTLSMLLGMVSCGTDSTLAESPTPSEIVSVQPSETISEEFNEETETSVQPSEEPMPAPSEEPSPVPSEEPLPAPSEEPTPAPSEEPTPAPSEEPAPTPSEEPAPTPSEEPSPAPSEEPAPEPSEEPSPIPSEEPEPVQPEFTSLISEVRRNEIVTITVQGEPNTEYTISVRYYSGHISEANGLGPATSDANGFVSWTWKVGGRTGFGTSTFTVSDGTTSVTYDFEVVEG